LPIGSIIIFFLLLPTIDPICCQKPKVEDQSMFTAIKSVEAQKKFKKTHISAVKLQYISSHCSESKKIHFIVNPI